MNSKTEILTEGGVFESPAPDDDETVYDKAYRKFKDELDYISAPWRFPLWQVANEPELFAYKAGNRADGICLVERINLPDNRVVIVCIQVSGNPGNSITNCVEELCFQICRRFEIDAEKLVWLEHYDYGSAPMEGEWNLVTFDRFPPERPFEGPNWTAMTDQMWRSLSLRPKKRLLIKYGQYQSKVRKLFNWPTENLV